MTDVIEIVLNRPERRNALGKLLLDQAGRDEFFRKN